MAKNVLENGAVEERNSWEGRKSSLTAAVVKAVATVLLAEWAISCTSAAQDYTSWTADQEIRAAEVGVKGKIEEYNKLFKMYEKAMSDLESWKYANDQEAYDNVVIQVEKLKDRIQELEEEIDDLWESKTERTLIKEKGKTDSEVENVKGRPVLSEPIKRRSFAEYQE